MEGLGVRMRYNPIDVGVRVALAEEVPSDWCYVNNFAEAHEPRAIELPPGKGAPFQKDMERLLEELGEAVQAAFSSDEYRSRMQAIKNEYRDKNMKFVQEIERLSKEKNLTPVQSPAGAAADRTVDRRRRAGQSGRPVRGRAV